MQSRSCFTRKIFAAACLAAVGGALAARAEPAQPARDDYLNLQQWRYSATPMAVPPAGLEWMLEGAHWRLDSGHVWLQEPISGGAVTGLVFAGRGRFSQEVPDAVELAQLRRFTGEPELDRIEVSFESMVLRSEDVLALTGVEAPAAGPFAPSKEARSRHEHWLVIRRHDADAAVIAALASPGETYLRADIRTPEHGWLTWELDTRRREEIRLETFVKKWAFLEEWLSLDRAAERNESGRPGGAWRPAAEIEHVDLSARLVKMGKFSGGGMTARHSLVAEIEARIALRARRSGDRALRLYLSPTAEVKSVAGRDGRELPFLRDHLGGRSAGIDNQVYDLALVVLLEEPLREGEPLDLRVVYELETTNFAPGRFWYPAVEYLDPALTDLHTATLSVTTRKEYSIRSMGEPLKESSEGNFKTARWQIEKPVKMLTFTINKKVREVSLVREGLPEIAVFAPPVGMDTDGKLEKLGADVQASMDFFQRLFAAPLPAAKIHATLIQAFHGQAYDGFLHLSDMSAYRHGQVGVNERFFAHEVAHQWWGQMVGWKSYRDQWLSEGLAEYSAMMYIESEMARGEKLFREILRAYTDELTGSIKSSMSGFTRQDAPMMHRMAARRIGPIGHGYRAATGEAPSAFYSQSYRKGALVLHMLRLLLEERTGDPGAFVEMLRDFVERHRGGYASTADLEAAVARRSPGDWSWFFDQWVYGAAIPAYRWSHRVEAPGADGSVSVELTVRQTDVPAGFTMPVPVRFELVGGVERDLSIVVDSPETRAEFRLPARPKKVIFNPDHAVLAKVKG